LLIMQVHMYEYIKEDKKCVLARAICIARMHGIYTISSFITRQ